MKKIIVLWSITTLLLLNGCEESKPPQSLSGPATKIPQTPPKNAKPPDKPTTATPPKTEDQTATPKPAADTHAVKPVTPPSPPQPAIAEKPVAPTTPPANQPIPLLGERKSPRLDVIGGEGIQLSLNIYFDNQLLCTISGKIDAKHHRPFQGGLLAEGVCYSNKMVSLGLHEYQLLGRLILPDGASKDVSFSTGQRNVTDVVQPAIEIHPDGKIEVKLAVG